MPSAEEMYSCTYVGWLARPSGHHMTYVGRTHGKQNKAVACS